MIVEEDKNFRYGQRSTRVLFDLYLLNKVIVSLIVICLDFLTSTNHSNRVRLVTSQQSASQFMEFRRHLFTSFHQLRFSFSITASRYHGAIRNVKLNVEHKNLLKSGSVVIVRLKLKRSRYNFLITQLKAKCIVLQNISSEQYWIFDNMPKISEFDNYSTMFIKFNGKAREFGDMLVIDC